LVAAHVAEIVEDDEVILVELLDDALERQRLPCGL
jgi:hypothetical protein